MLTAQEVIDLLGLEPLPLEGGHFVEVFRSTHSIPGSALPEGFPGPRVLATSIYYLLKDGEYSRLHRLPGPEIYHFCLGDPLEMLILPERGGPRRPVLGSDLRQGELPVVVVPALAWQGSSLRPGGRHGYALVGATVTPGYEFGDAQFADPTDLVRCYPSHRARIEELAPRRDP